MGSHQEQHGDEVNSNAVPAVDRPVVLVGMMGVGKTSIGKRLAARLGLDFVDADEEIEAAAGMTIAEIFEKFGEPYFRDGERRVISRLIDGTPKVIATGGGAFINGDTRALILERALSIWLDADVRILAERVARRSHRPLLHGRDPVEVGIREHPLLAGRGERARTVGGWGRERKRGGRDKGQVQKRHLGSPEVRERPRWRRPASHRDCASKGNPKANDFAARRPRSPSPTRITGFP